MGRKAILILFVAALFLVLSVSVASATVSLNSPVAGGNYSTTITFNCTQAITDIVNATNATLYYNSSGGVVGTVLVTETNDSLDDVYFYNSTIDISSLSDLATYNFSCLIDNGSTQTYSAAAGNVVIDNTAPIISILYPTNSSSHAGIADVDVNYSASDATAGLGSCWYWNGTGNTSLTNCDTNITGVAWTDGVTNIIIYTNDTANNVNSAGITFTTFPQISWGAVTQSDGANVSNLWIYANVSVTEFNPLNITFELSNSTKSIINSTGYSGTLNTTRAINFTNSTAGALTDGVYYYNVTFTDITGNINTTLSRKITLDTTPPVISVSASTTTKTALTLAVSITEAGSTIDGTCTIDSTTGTITGTGNSQTITETGLTCGTSYSYNVTCVDFAGNKNEAVNSFTTTACGSSSSSGGTGTTTTTWTTTYSYTDEDFSDVGSVEKEMGARSRVRIKLNSAFHHVGILEVGTDSVKIEVSSTPQEATLNVGDTKMFDLNGDGVYDIKVGLISIASGKANLKVESISEEQIEVSGEEIPKAGEKIPEKKSEGISATTWIIIGIIVAIAITAVIIMKRKK